MGLPTPFPRVSPDAAADRLAAARRIFGAVAVAYPIVAATPIAAGLVRGMVEGVPLRGVELAGWMQSVVALALLLAMAVGGGMAGRGHDAGVCVVRAAGLGLAVLTLGAAVAWQLHWGVLQLPRPELAMVAGRIVASAFGTPLVFLCFSFPLGRPRG